MYTINKSDIDIYVEEYIEYKTDCWINCLEEGSFCTTTLSDKEKNYNKTDFDDCVCRIVNYNFKMFASVIKDYLSKFKFYCQSVEKKNLLLEPYYSNEICKRFNTYGEHFYLFNEYYTIDENSLNKIMEAKKLRDIRFKDLDDILLTNIIGNKKWCDSLVSSIPHLISGGLVALDNDDEIIGVCSYVEETDKVCLVGVEVKEEFRTKGIGTYMLSSMMHTIIKSGSVPIYRINSSDIASKRLALACGLKPKWCEVSYYLK